MVQRKKLEKPKPAAASEYVRVISGKWMHDVPGKGLAVRVRYVRNGHVGVCYASSMMQADIEQAVMQQPQQEAA